MDEYLSICIFVRIFFFFEKKYPSERVIIPRIGTEDEKKILILLLRKENNGHGNITSLNEL